MGRKQVNASSGSGIVGITVTVGVKEGSGDGVISKICVGVDEGVAVGWAGGVPVSGGGV